MICKTISILFLISTFFSFQSGSCYQKPNDEITKIDIVEGDKGLLIFFKKDISPNAPYEFGNTILSNPNTEGNGYRSLDGIELQFALEPINGHDGVAVKFRDNATTQQIETIKARVKESPLVYKVYENVVPNEIKDLDQPGK